MIRSAVVTMLFLAFLELLGAREHVSALSGTVTSRASLFLGLLYALTFFVVVLLGPPLLVTGLLSGNSSSARPRARSSRSPSQS